MNRNYGFEHLSGFSQVDRSTIGPDGKWSNGLNDDGTFNLDSDSYPGPQPFSEIESQAVRGLVDNSFQTGNEVDRIRCSLSWHSYGGMVLHPMGHLIAQPGLSTLDRQCFTKLSNSFANESGYINMRDTFPTVYYPSYGDSDDWLFKERRVHALTVEAFGHPEGNPSYPNGDFNPDTKARFDQAVDLNIDGAKAIMRVCPCTPD